MIDLPDALPAYEQVLIQKLIHCGLRRAGFTVKYERELQSIEIVISQEAGATPGHLDCIKQAAGYEIVTFANPELQEAYADRVSEALRPRMLADARAELERRGVLQGFPERANFASDKLFAEALERQCGMEPSSFFVESQGDLVSQPNLESQSKSDEEKTSCLVAALLYVSAKGEPFKFGFRGNEAIAPER